jgi:hypothetical protein
VRRLLSLAPDSDLKNSGIVEEPCNQRKLLITISEKVGNNAAYQGVAQKATDHEVINEHSVIIDRNSHSPHEAISGEVYLQVLTCRAAVARVLTVWDAFRSFNAGELVLCRWRTRMAGALVNTI